jgi:hypothetical protein
MKFHLFNEEQLLRKVLLCVIVGIIAMTGTTFNAILHCSCAYADPVRSTIQVSARVVSHFRIKVIHQVSRIKITRADIRRGYIDIGDALHFEITSNNPRGYVLTFQQISSAFKGLYVKAGETDTYLDGCQGLIKRPHVKGTEVVRFSYRLILSEHIEPGTHACPVYIGTTDVIPDL